MPSNNWVANHRQLKIWLSASDYDAFRLACVKRGVSLTEALRPAIAQLIKEGK